MVEVTDGTNTLAVYVFDGAGRRIIEKSYSGGTLSETRYVYYSSQWQRLEIRVGGTSSSDLERQYIWGVRYVDDLVQRERDTTGDGSLDETLYAAQDANFRVVALVDTSGGVVERYTYDPYGTRIILDASFGPLSSSAYEMRIGHQGLYHDPETGLVENRARMLHPSLGRFMQRDPLGYVDGMSLYEYVGSMPILYVDPAGQFCWSCIGAAGAGIAAAAGVYAAIVACPIGETPPTLAACIAALAAAVGGLLGAIAGLAGCISCLESQPCPNTKRIARLEKEEAKDKKELDKIEKLLHLKKKQQRKQSGQGNGSNNSGGHSRHNKGGGHASPSKPTRPFVPLPYFT